MIPTPGLQERGDRCSALMFAACMATIRAREGHFGAPRVLEAEGLRHVVVTELGGTWLLLNSDGVGTKIDVAERLKRYDTIAYDLLAMLTDDAVRFGAQPLSVSNVLDCTRAEPEVVEKLAAGLAVAAQEAEVAVVGGEVAELGTRVAGAQGLPGCNWAGTLLSVVPRERVLTGAGLAAGQSVVALREKGFRSNGFTLARRILNEHLGPAWHQKAFGERSWGEELLRPSQIYAPSLLDAIGRLDAEPKAAVTGLVHVTGGGVPEKLGRMLRGRGLGAELDALFEPCGAMLTLQRWGGVSDREAYRTWNMGNGMLAVTPEPDALLAVLEARGVEARVAGRLTSGGPVGVTSRGALTPEMRLGFEVEDGSR
jgi:phosphoribosylformylglycinamidine cyclo-ligase